MITRNAVKECGKVGVLFGGRSAEREVSIMSGKGVLEALLSKGVDAHAFDPGVKNLAELADQKFDRVFIALHGRYGEDGSIQGALEQLNIPYTGSGVLASALAADKAMTKRIWSAGGLVTPQFALLSEASDWEAIAKCLGLPLIVKPAHEGSTFGLTKVNKVEQLATAYALAAKFDRVVIAEEFIDGMEITCAVLGKEEDARALPLIQLAPQNGIYDFQQKYITNDTTYFCPAEIPDEQAHAIQEMVVASYRALGCRGWGRADVMVRATDKKAFLLEMNTSPGMTGHSLVPMAAK
ncbi:MAG: D-alanine--D-alanine ligase, partial [Solimicrobium sp.]|nr:D-alanine--D-alanine ligase [Solimicrobium sp.]